MNTTKTKTCTAPLVTFGQDFENFGGLRALAIADGMHDEDPVSDVGYNLDTMSSRLGDLAEDGYENLEELEPFVDACLELREQYGHEVWIGAALLDFLHGVKGIQFPHAAAIRDRLMSEARARFAPVYATYELRRDRDNLEWAENYLGRLIADVRLVKSQVKRLKRQVYEHQAA